MNDSIPKNLNSRDASADILKAVAIFAVVFIHGSSLIPVIPDNYHIRGIDKNFITNIFRMCVPVFIFLWAYFSEKSVLKKGKGTVLPRLYQLFIPFFFWSLVYFIYTADFKHLGIGSMISKHWVGYGWSGQYYFIILFQLILLFGIIRMISLRLKEYVPAIFLVSVLFYAVLSYSGWFNIGVIGKLSYRPFIYWIPYVVLGVLYAHKDIFKFSVPLWVSLLSVVLILAEIYFLNPSLKNIYMLPSVFIVTLLMVNSMQLKLTYGSLGPVTGKIVQTLAKSTLGIFCLNPLVFLAGSSAFALLGFHIQVHGIEMLMSIVSTIFIIGVCLLIINILKSVRLGILVAN